MNLRLYTFVNFYLSSIQQGIQSAHVAVDMLTQYKGRRGNAVNLLNTWAAEDKTMIVLNGGMACDVSDGYEGMCMYDKSPYPFTAFFEEPGAIHHSHKAITAWGLVLPPDVYNAKPVEVFPSRTGFSTLPAQELETQSAQRVIPGMWERGSVEHFICSYLQGKRLAQ